MQNAKTKNATLTEDLLIEIGLEELPPNEVEVLSNALQTAMEILLKKNELSFDTIKSFGTPRRISLYIKDLSLEQPPRTLFKKGPKTSVAFDASGKPTPIGLGFAKSNHVDIKSLTIQETSDGTILVYEQHLQSESSAHLLPKLVDQLLHNLPLSKHMRWGEKSEEFIRPIHWITMLLGKKPLSGKVFDLAIGGDIYGHRFHHPSTLKLSLPRDYEKLLETQGYVIPDFAKRQHKILEDIQALEKKQGFKTLIDNSLLYEITGLVEWPVVHLGNFDTAFLNLPKEVLIASMQVHQKCFAVVKANDHTTLLPHFIIVSNIAASDPSAIIQGNERVMHARLQDASFHYRIDKIERLEARLPKLNQIIFQAKLGSMKDKVERLKKLSVEIAKSLGANQDVVARAAELSKTDLLTQMVGEFPELQGIMGRYYALNDGESPEVAFAIQEHYHPRFAIDSLPITKEALCIAIADRLDTLVGIFGLGKKPSGDSDPFALRRQALGVLRMLIEKTLDLNLKDLINTAIHLYREPLPEKNIQDNLLGFCFERLRAWYLEQGIPPKVFEAVLARQNTNPLDFHHRLTAVDRFHTLAEAESLASANKRVHNILSKTDGISSLAGPLDMKLIEAPAEKTLAEALNAQEKIITPLIKSSQYSEALVSLATLKTSIDNFFNEVMVMTDNIQLRNNRLKLLTALRNLFLEIADISLL